MGFLADSNNNVSVYTEVKQEPVLVRPLALKPTSVWVHKIQEVRQPNSQPNTPPLRKFAYETCTANNRSGSGCTLCCMPDPLHHMLAADEQTNRNGKRVDFPKTPIHFLPVFNHATGAVEALKGGNQIFQEMDKWYDQQPEGQKDLRRCDWRVWKTGERKKTQYSSIRLDASAFTISPELEEQAKNVLVRVMEDRRPTEVAKLLSSVRGEQTLAFDSGPVAAQSSLPSGVAVNSGFLNTVTSPSFGTAVPVAAPVSVPVVAAAKAPAVEPVVANGKQASKDVVEGFIAWLNMQPEFQGIGMMTNLLPLLKKEIGHVDYYKLSSEQIVDLKSKLEPQLATMRAGK